MGSPTITVRMPDIESYETVKTILAYESAIRGRRIGQTFAELIVEAADVGSYPDEVRERLQEISQRAEGKAVERFLSGFSSEDPPDV